MNPHRESKQVPSLEFKEVDGGVLLSVKVLPGSKQEGIRGTIDGSLKVAVRAPAEKGKANKAVLALLANRLEIGKGQIEIVSGQTDSRKVLLLKNLDAGHATDRLLG